MWHEGSTKTLEDLKNVGKKSKLLFAGDIKDNLAEAYTIHNLKPSTAYKV